MAKFKVFVTLEAYDDFVVETQFGDRLKTLVNNPNWQHGFAKEMMEQYREDVSVSIIEVSEDNAVDAVLDDDKSLDWL